MHRIFMFPLFAISYSQLFCVFHLLPFHFPRPIYTFPIFCVNLHSFGSRRRRESQILLGIGQALASKSSSPRFFVPFSHVLWDPFFTSPSLRTSGSVSSGVSTHSRSEGISQAGNVVSRRSVGSAGSLVGQRRRRRFCTL